MSYLHCHSCNWSQDDFWHEGYNPIKFLEENYKKNLLEEDLDNIHEVQRDVNGPDGWDFYIAKVTNRELIINEFESAIIRIKSMKYRTLEEFKADKDAKCPGCGKKDWDID